MSHGKRNTSIISTEQHTNKKETRAVVASAVKLAFELAALTSPRDGTPWLHRASPGAVKLAPMLAVEPAVELAVETAVETAVKLAVPGATKQALGSPLNK